MVTDTGLQTNTSTWWFGNGTTGPVGNDDVGANYAFGFYANVYAPDFNSPWYVQGPTGPQSKNPYSGGSEVSRYTETLRLGVTGQYQTTRAYSYAHDDAYSTVYCNAAQVQNLLPSDGRGAYYAGYEVLMIISEEAP